MVMTPESALLFSSLDGHFAAFLSRLATTDSPELHLAAKLVSRRVAEGHICLDLTALAGQPLTVADRQWRCPELAGWLNKLTASGVVGQPGEDKPLVLDGRARLYFHRYWQYETAVAEFINNRGTAPEGELDFNRLAEGLRRLFPAVTGRRPEIDWQKIAAITAVLRPFAVITGGPGTGKTSTVAKILALLLEQAEDRQRPRILLAAPTGKAAVRLQEALAGAKADLPTAAANRAAMPTQVSTLHRLLGPIPGSPYFRFNADNPLPAEVIIVDEASMVDLPMMAKLMQAVPAAARLILLGDRNQLASVEPGSVLGDICHPDYLPGFSAGFRRYVAELTGLDLDGGKAFGENPHLGDALVELRKSYRFAADSGIRAMSRAVDQGDPETAIAVLTDRAYTDIAFAEAPAPAGLEQMLAGNAALSRHIFGPDPTPTPAAAFAALNRCRILCALRKGPYGVGRVNQTVEGILARRKIIAPASPDYQGRPVMITENNYPMQLYNGDVGIMLPDWQEPGMAAAGPQELRVFFPGPAGGFRRFSPRRLPPHETVYAMTVHKSQGSEFDHILLILPDKAAPVLTRELIYTAITRARKTVEIWGRLAVIRLALSTSVRRASGLREKLWP